MVQSEARRWSFIYRNRQGSIAACLVLLLLFLFLFLLLFFLGGGVIISFFLFFFGGGGGGAVKHDSISLQGFSFMLTVMLTFQVLSLHVNMTVPSYIGDINIPRSAPTWQRDCTILHWRHRHSKVCPYMAT